MQVAPRRVERPRAVRIRSLRTQQRAKSQCQQTPSAPGPPGAARIPLVNDRRSDVCSLPDAHPLAGVSSNSGSASPGGPRFMCHLSPACRCVVIDIYGEFDPGSGRTLAACLTHASRARLHPSGWCPSGERVSNTWATCPHLWDNPGKPELIPDTRPHGITRSGKNFGWGWARGLSASW